jgi:hypothetical protein
MLEAISQAEQTIVEFDDFYDALFEQHPKEVKQWMKVYDRWYETEGWNTQDDNACPFKDTTARTSHYQITSQSGSKLNVQIPCSKMCSCELRKI